jgi:L-alanine-DL-glutamate epimerase-like enolase superfamily enzyme
MTVKIEDVEVVHLHLADPNISIFDGSYDICLVVIRTDTGIVGIGETEITSVRGASDHRRANGAQPRSGAP